MAFSRRSLHRAAASTVRPHGPGAARLAQEAEDIATEARAVNSLGMVAADRKDYTRAIREYERAVSLAQKARDRELEGKCYGNLGIAFKNRGEADLGRALDHQQRAQVVAAEVGDKRSEGRTLGNIGLLYSARGDRAMACHYYGRALAIAEMLGDWEHIGIWHHNMGEDLADNDPAAAMIHLVAAHDMFTRLRQFAFARESDAALKRVSAGLAK